ncbi:MAG: hypothetical protein ACYTXT_16955 [Nostoc sp.]
MERERAEAENAAWAGQCWQVLQRASHQFMYNTKAYAAASATSPLSSTKIKRRDPIVLPSLEELGIGLVPFSPLGKGFLTGSKRIQGYGSSCAQCRSNAD